MPGVTTLQSPRLRVQYDPSLLTVFCTFLAAYLLTWGGHYTSGDGAVKLAWTRALIAGGGVDIDPAPGVQVSKYGIGHSLVALVPVAVGRVAERVSGVRLEVALYTLLFVVNGALLLALVAAYARRSYDPPRVWALLVALGLGTIWWPYTKLDFSEPLVATCLFGGFLLVRRGRPSTGVALAGFCGLLRPDAFLLAAWLAVWAIIVAGPSRRLATQVVGALVPAVAAHLLTNVGRYGSALTGYPGETFSTPALEGLWGLLLSPGKSVLLYSPPLLLALVAIPAFARTSRMHRQDVVFFLGVLLLQLLLYCRWWDWSGDDAWGPRFLVPGVVLATIPAVAMLGRRPLATTVIVLGISVQLCAVLVSPLDFVLLVRTAGGPPATNADPTSKRLGLDDIRFDRRYSPILGHLLLLRELVSAAPASGRPPGVSTALYGAFSPSEWQASARWDPISIRAARCLASGREALDGRQCLAR